MVGTYCCITGCKSNSTRSRDASISFHKFPKEPKLRQIWIDAINNNGPRLKRMFTSTGARAVFSPKHFHRICGKHFVKGRLTFDDNVPSVFSSPQQENIRCRLLKSPDIETKSNSPKSSYNPNCSPLKEFAPPLNGHVSSAPKEIISSNPGNLHINEVGTADVSRNNGDISNISGGIDLNTSISVSVKLEQSLDYSRIHNMQSKSIDNSSDKLQDLLRTESQAWDESKKELHKQIQELESLVKNLYVQNDNLQSVVNKNLFREENVEDEQFKFYTGLHRETFNALFELLQEDAQSLIYYRSSSSANANLPDQPNKKKGKSRVLNLRNELFLVLIRLRQGMPVTDLAYRFRISISSVSRIFITWIDFLNNRLSQLPIWPSKEFVNQTMPACFKEKYSDTRIILDCTEIYVDMPSCFRVQSETYSSYKSHNTAKGLIGVSPAGLISFVSDLVPGRLSDREITKRCGLIDMLDEGDSVMADKGFLIEDLLNEKQISLNILPFLRGAEQLSKEQEEETHRLESLRNHVERTIRRVKSFRILKYIVPTTITPDLNKIWRVCCHLANFTSEPVTTKEK